ncbi:MAG: hypothetical protein IPK58_14140 [Acidobacteria bacterium]|nr:hypothetical protein [Acidobacteriota bacterium]
MRFAICDLRLQNSRYSRFQIPDSGDSRFRRFQIPEIPDSRDSRFQRFQIPDSRFQTWNLECGICGIANPKSQIPNIPNPKSQIPNPFILRASR